MTFRGALGMKGQQLAHCEEQGSLWLQLVLLVMKLAGPSVWLLELQEEQSNTRQVVVQLQQQRHLWLPSYLWTLLESCSYSCHSTRKKWQQPRRQQLLVMLHLQYPLLLLRLCPLLLLLPSFKQVLMEGGRAGSRPLVQNPGALCPGAAAVVGAQVEMLLQPRGSLAFLMAPEVSHVAEASACLVKLQPLVAGTAVEGGLKGAACLHLARLQLLLLVTAVQEALGKGGFRILVGSRAAARELQQEEHPLCLLALREVRQLQARAREVA
jgi:hypothetical protein